MIFSSFTFLLLFLPIVMFCYYLPFGIKYKNAILLIASLVFYGMGEPVYIILLVISSLINYFAGVFISSYRHAKSIMIFTVMADILCLVLFKYTGIVKTMPVGISFYIFQEISYVADVYKDKSIVQKNYGKMLLYISFFPQLIAGPIVKYHDINEQLENRTIDISKISDGLKRFLFGLSKKVILANTLGFIVDQAYSYNNSDVNAFIAWSAALLYCFQIYYDFSGYSDMAIGLAAMFGISLKENFQYPYAATSIKQFWRRWHISLSSWFKEYLYIPLGGNRKGKIRTYINKYIVFFCTGLWHGASINFVIWGLIHGTFSVLEEVKTYNKITKNRVVGWIYTFLVVTFSFVFFRSDNISQAVCFLGNMFTGWNAGNVVIHQYLVYFNPFNIFIIIIAAIGIFPIKNILPKNTVTKVLGYIFSIVCLLLCIMLLATEQYNPFIYYRF